MNKITKNILVGLFVFMALAALLSLYNIPAKKPQMVDLGTLVNQIDKEEIKAIAVKGNQLNITLNNGDLEISQKEPADSISALLKNLNVNPDKIKKIAISVESEDGLKFWLATILPLAIPILFIVGFLWFMMRQVQGANSKALGFGQSRAREFNPNQATKITFKDVAGVKEGKQELVEVVDFLKNPKKYLNLGARIPKGVLLVGAPGTGKTLLAKAVAGEANVPFFNISGSEFVEMFVGVGASVTGDTPILVKTEKGGIRLRPIAEIVDRYYQDGESGTVKKVPGLQTLGLAPLKTNFRGTRSKDKLFFGGSCWSGVHGVLRHKVDEVYTIHYRGGKIRTTGDHSIFVRDGNMVRAKKAVELKTGDILVNLPFKVRSAFVPGLGTTHIVRHHEFKEEEKEAFLDLYGGELLETEKKYSYALEMSGTMSQYAIAEKVGVSQATVGNWQNRVHRPQFLSNTLITASTSSRLKITADLLRLMGYYAAEGRVTKYYTQFVFGLHEADLHADCGQLIRNIFKVEPNITEMGATNSLRITVSSPIVSRFFEKHIGMGSKNKHLPQFLWTASKDFFLAFLNGYSRGDGYTTKDGKLSITSVSQQIIRELAWLASMHGIQTGIRQTVTPAGRTIKGGQPLPETVAWNLIIGKSSHPFRPYEGTVNQFKKPIVQKIEKTPYDGYVYDFCGCDHEAFFGGDKPILLHNSRVRDLFAKAKKYTPCIVFIDELDAVGRQRGAGLGGSHDEREQTLNQILVEMDGFDPNTNVIVMAATNRPDVLDSALLRPGRFDRQVILDLPDINDREEILKVHSRQKPFAEDVNMRRVAERTPGFSGADLANLLNEAAILTALQNRKKITNNDILISIDKVLLGPERKSHILSVDEKKITAYHEAGHALVAHELPHTDPIRKISIVARGMAAGFTLKLPTEDKKLHSRSEFLEELAVLIGGRVAEEEIFQEITTGAQNDLRQATQLAKKIITEYGMSDKLGLRTYGQKEELIFLGRELHEQRDYSEKSAEEIDREINRLLEEATKVARKILNDKRKYLAKIADTLLIKETIETEEFEALFKEETPPAA